MTFFLTYTRRQLCAILQFMQFILVLNVVKQIFFTFFHFFSKKICKPQNVRRIFALAIQKKHRTLIAHSSHYHRTRAHE